MPHAKGLINYLNYCATGDFYGFQDPQPLAAGRRCLRRFGDLRKNTPQDFLNKYILNFDDLLLFLVMFDDFGMSGLVFLVSVLEPAKCERCK